MTTLNPVQRNLLAATYPTVGERAALANKLLVPVADVEAAVQGHSMSSQVYAGKLANHLDSITPEPIDFDLTGEDAPFPQPPADSYEVET